MGPEKNEIEKHLESAMRGGLDDNDDVTPQRPVDLEMNEQGDTVALYWMRGMS